MTTRKHLPLTSSVRSLWLALALAVVCGLSFAGWRVGASRGAPASGLPRFVSAAVPSSVPVGAAVMPLLSGTKSVCPAGCDYASLTVAITDIQAQGLNGALTLELGATYVSTGETFPLTIPSLNGASAVNTITIRPASGAANLAITSANATATVNLDNGSFVTFDGRAGGVGTTKQLTIENTVATGVAVQLVNGASSNAFRYVAFKSVINGTTATIYFGGTANANGNSNNLIDNCDIGNGATLPTNAIYSAPSGQNNSNNTVSNSNIFNYYSTASSNGWGLRFEAANTGWTITGNSFYQTATRTANANVVFGIGVFGGDGYTITNNFIGGSAPSAGGAAWTTTGTTVAHRFVGIQLNVGTTTPISSVQGNTIQNFVWTSLSNAAALPGVWSGIYVQGGAVNVGTTAGNTIGSGSGTDSVFLTIATNGGTTFGISSSSSNAVNISNNTIGSITTNGTSTSISASLVGIQATGGANTISNNTVGSTTTANSLYAATSSISSTGQGVTGILSSSTLGASITGNTVANLNNNYAGTAVGGQIRGIVTPSGAAYVYFAPPPPPPSPVCSNFVNKTTANGLGSNSVLGVFAVGTTVYAATSGGFAISTDGGAKRGEKCDPC